MTLDSVVWELEGKTTLIAGLGGIGTEVARRAHAFGMRLTATRNSSRAGPDFVDHVGLSPGTVTLAAEADVVVDALPLTPETRGLFDAAFFAAMKPGAYFVNVSRGERVVTSDLVDALRSGHLAGAGLDVTSPEPLPPGHPPWSLPNVVLTPHSAGASDQVKRRILLLATENARRYASGGRMLSVVDPRRGYRAARPPLLPFADGARTPLPVPAACARDPESHDPTGRRGDSQRTRNTTT